MLLPQHFCLKWFEEVRVIHTFSFAPALHCTLCLCAYVDTLNLYYVIYVYVAVILRIPLPKQLNPEHEHCNH